MTAAERLACRFLWAVCKAGLFPAVYLFCNAIEPFGGKFFG